MCVVCRVCVRALTLPQEERRLQRERFEREEEERRKKREEEDKARKLRLAMLLGGEEATRKMEEVRPGAHWTRCVALCVCVLCVV